MPWSTDRRAFLRLTGAAFAAATTAPRFAWAAEGTTLRLRVDADLQVLDPKTLIGNLDDITLRMTQVTLVRLSDMRDGNTLSNYAAEVFQWRDPQTIAFTLRAGLVWTGDFGPVTADDVKFSFERIAGSDSPWAYQMESLREVEVIDDRQGLIHLNAPFAPFPVIALPYYAGHIVSRKAVEAAGGAYTTELPAQCGPFLFDNWEQGQKVTYRANPAWTGEKQLWQVIEIYIVTDNQAAQLAYEADSFDFTRIDVVAAAALRDAPLPGATLIEAQSTRYTWLTINMNAEPLKDLRVRQAIQYAYDGDAVLIGAYDGLVTRATGVVQPGPFSRPGNLIATRDVEKAKALLAEAGAEGLTLNLVALTDATSQAMAQIIQASLAEAGITVILQPTEEAVYWALGDKTAGDDYLSLELVLMEFAGGIDPTENLVWFRPDQIGVYNWSFFDSPKFEDLYQQSLVETGPDKRRAMFNTMEDLMEASGGFIFIGFAPYVALTDSNLTPMILADGHPDPTRFALT
jgi:peptide/nickel transport system substrate-binding protein